MKPARPGKAKPPTVVVIAGPNGAGKSTAAPFLLKQALGILEFVNADQIAVGLSAYAPETVSFEAGRIMLKRLHELAESGTSFAFESTLSSRTFALFLTRCKARGYSVQIFYVALPSAELAVKVQAATLENIEHNYQLDELKNSILTNGYVPMERIIVTP